MRRSLTPLISSMLCAMVTAQEGVPQPDGLVPEQMWYAPSAEDWKKPPLIRWQRTWADAVRLSQQTKKPIMVCVNMDGEIASEHYAGVRYRDPEVAKLFEPYVCVMASVYRHNPRDYDDQGRRIPCPRLGCVTCGEHIALEPLVFEKFLDGKRISPRHIMVELDGSEVYDVFYTWDVKSVLDSLENGIKDREIQAPPIVKGDRSLKERIESPDSADREAVEAEFAEASAALRKRMLELGIGAGDKVPLEMLRQAAYGLDPDLAKRARDGMKQSDDLLAVELIADTLRGPLAAEERVGLVDALDRFRDRSTRARTLATAHRGLDQGASSIDGQKWQSVLVGPAYSGITDVAAVASQRDAALAATPDDLGARLDVAESSLLQALEVQVGRARGGVRLAQAQRTLLLEDAKRNLQTAVAAGAEGWRPKALEAVLRSELGQRRRAFGLATEAMPDLPPDAPGRLAKELLELFAHGRQAAIQDAVRQKEEWPGAWTSDVHTAYTLLMRHPLGTPEHVADHYDFLEFFRSPDAEVVLQKGVERFPAAAPLHHRLRGLWLRQGGVARMEREYAKWLARDDAPAVLPWFAGYASLVAAEQHRRRSKPAAARESYNHALRHFASYRDQTRSGDGAHYEAMAHGGLARLALQDGDLGLTFSELQQVFRIAPQAAGAIDGLSITAMQTAEALRGKALRDDPDLVELLDAALQELPDEAFLLPEYEQRNPGNPRYSRLKPRR